MSEKWMTYTEQLQTKEWFAFRKQVYRRDKYACVDCGENGERMHCHHEYYVVNKKAWQYPLEAFVTLCGGCHEKRHRHFSMIPHVTQADAEMWFLFTLADKYILEEYMSERGNRIQWIEERGGTWEPNGRFWSFVDKKGRRRIYDEDGYSM